MSTENKYQFKGTPAPWFVCKHHAYDGECVVFSNPDEMPEGINDYIDCNTPEDAHLCAAAAFTQISVKQPIDDRGTLSDEGYTYEDCEAIQKELEFLQRKLLALNVK